MRISESMFDEMIARGEEPPINEDVVRFGGEDEQPAVSESAPVEEDFASTREFIEARATWHNRVRLRAFVRGEVL